MNANRLWMIGTVLVTAVIVLGGWFIGAEPFLTAAAKADTDRAAIEQQIAAGEAVILQLTDEKKQQPELEERFVELQRSLPPAARTSEFITGLDVLAGQSGVSIGSITLADPKPYTMPASATQLPAESTDTSAVPETEADAPVAVVPVGPLPPTAVTSPLVTGDNLLGIMVTIDVSGENAAVLSFVNGLQSGERLFLVTGYSASDEGTTGEHTDDGADAAPAAPTVTAKVTGYIFVLKTGGAAS